MSNQIQSPNEGNEKRYDLAERTAVFGEDVIEFVQPLSDSPINRPIISQLVRSAGSIGANYMEADGAESKKDFQHKMSICKKEAKETMHWLRLIAKANATEADNCRTLWREAHELVLIFSSIVNKVRK